jgi:hypothetical protein
MWAKLWIVPFIFSITATLSPAKQEIPASQTSSAPSQISPLEAEIEIYLLPDCRRLRAKGGTVGWVQSLNPDLNREDYYFFFVFAENHGQQAEGSVTIGNFAVNRWTAEVRNSVFDEPLLDPELAGLQRILIHGHHIDEATLKKYESRPLWSAAK